MRRGFFIRSLATAVSGIFLPFSSSARPGIRGKKGIMVSSGKDRFDKPLALFEGDKFYCKVSPSDTNGDLYVFDSTRLKEGGPPLHVHPEQDEFWYVISGEYLIRVGEETFKAKAGDCVFGPRGVPHAFAKLGAEESKLLLLFQPAGQMEAYFQAVSEGRVAKMAKEEQDRFRKEHGIIHVGPPIGELKK